jgi:hypothetical protein
MSNNHDIGITVKANDNPDYGPITGTFFMDDIVIFNLTYSNTSTEVSSLQVQTSFSGVQYVSSECYESDNLSSTGLWTINNIIEGDTRTAFIVAKIININTYIEIINIVNPPAGNPPAKNTASTNLTTHTDVQITNITSTPSSGHYDDVITLKCDVKVNHRSELSYIDINNIPPENFSQNGVSNAGPINNTEYILNYPNTGETTFRLGDIKGSALVTDGDEYHLESEYVIKDIIATPPEDIISTIRINPKLTKNNIHDNDYTVTTVNSGSNNNHVLGLTVKANDNPDYGPVTNNYFMDDLVIFNLSYDNTLTNVDSLQVQTNFSGVQYVSSSDEISSSGLWTIDNIVAGDNRTGYVVAKIINVDTFTETINIVNPPVDNLQNSASATLTTHTDVQITNVVSSPSSGHYDDVITLKCDVKINHRGDKPFLDIDNILPTNFSQNGVSNAGPINNTKYYTGYPDDMTLFRIGYIDDVSPPVADGDEAHLESQYIIKDVIANPPQDIISTIRINPVLLKNNVRDTDYNVTTVNSGSNNNHVLGLTVKANDNPDYGPVTNNYFMDDLVIFNLSYTNTLTTVDSLQVQTNFTGVEYVSSSEDITSGGIWTINDIVEGDNRTAYVVAKIVNVETFTETISFVNAPIDNPQNTASTILTTHTDVQITNVISSPASGHYDDVITLECDVKINHRGDEKWLDVFNKPPKGFTENGVSNAGSDNNTKYYTDTPEDGETLFRIGYIDDTSPPVKDGDEAHLESQYVIKDIITNPPQDIISTISIRPNLIKNNVRTMDYNVTTVNLGSTNNHVLGLTVKANDNPDYGPVTNNYFMDDLVIFDLTYTNTLTTVDSLQVQTNFSGVQYITSGQTGSGNITSGGLWTINDIVEGDNRTAYVVAKIVNVDTFTESISFVNAPAGNPHNTASATLITHSDISIVAESDPTRGYRNNIITLKLAVTFTHRSDQDHIDLGVRVPSGFDWTGYTNADPPQNNIYSWSDADGVNFRIGTWNGTSAPIEGNTYVILVKYKITKRLDIPPEDITTIVNIGDAWVKNNVSAMQYTVTTVNLGPTPFNSIMSVGTLPDGSPTDLYVGDSFKLDNIIQNIQCSDDIHYIQFNFNIWGESHWTIPEWYSGNFQNFDNQWENNKTLFNLWDPQPNTPYGVHITETNIDPHATYPYKCLWRFTAVFYEIRPWCQGCEHFPINQSVELPIIIHPIPNVTIDIESLHIKPDDPSFEGDHVFNLGDTIQYTLTINPLVTDNFGVVKPFIVDALLPLIVDYESSTGDGTYDPLTGEWTVLGPSDSFVEGTPLTMTIVGTIISTGLIDYIATFRNQIPRNLSSGSDEDTINILPLLDMKEVPWDGSILIGLSVDIIKENGALMHPSDNVIYDNFLIGVTWEVKNTDTVAKNSVHTYLPVNSDSAGSIELGYSYNPLLKVSLVAWSKNINISQTPGTPNDWVGTNYDDQSGYYYNGGIAETFSLGAKGEDDDTIVFKTLFRIESNPESYKNDYDFPFPIAIGQLDPDHQHEEVNMWKHGIAQSSQIVNAEEYIKGIVVSFPQYFKQQEISPGLPAFSNHTSLVFKSDKVMENWYNTNIPIYYEFDPTYFNLDQTHLITDPGHYTLNLKYGTDANVNVDFSLTGIKYHKRLVDNPDGWFTPFRVYFNQLYASKILNAYVNNTNSRDLTTFTNIFIDSNQYNGWVDSSKSTLKIISKCELNYIDEEGINHEGLNYDDQKLLLSGYAYDYTIIVEGDFQCPELDFNSHIYLNDRNIISLEKVPCFRNQTNTFTSTVTFSDDDFTSYHSEYRNTNRTDVPEELKMKIVYPEIIYTYKRSDIIDNMVQYLDYNDNNLFWMDNTVEDRFRYELNLQTIRNPKLPYYPDYIFEDSILTFDWSLDNFARFESNNQNTITLPLDFNKTIKKVIYSYLPDSITPLPGDKFTGSIIAHITEPGFHQDQEIKYVLHIFRSLYDLIPKLMIKVGDNDIVYMNKNSYIGALRLRNTEVEFINTTIHEMSISYNLTYNKQIIHIIEYQTPYTTFSQTEDGCNITLTIPPGGKITRYTELPFDVTFNYPDNRGFYKPFIFMKGDELEFNSDGVIINVDVIPEDIHLTNDFNKGTFLPCNVNNCDHVGIGLYKPIFLNKGKMVVRYFLPVIHTMGFVGGSELFLQDLTADVSPKLDLSTFVNPVVGNYIYGKKLTSSDASFNFFMRMETLPMMNRVFNRLVSDIQAFNYVMNEEMYLVEDYDSSIYKKVNFSSAVTKRYEKGLSTTLVFNNPNSLSYDLNDDFDDENWYRGQYPSEELFFFIDKNAGHEKLNIYFQNLSDTYWTRKTISLKNLNPNNIYVYLNTSKTVMVAKEFDDEIHVLEEVNDLVDTITDNVVMSNYGKYNISYDVIENDTTIRWSIDTSL